MRRRRRRPWRKHQNSPACSPPVPPRSRHRRVSSRSEEHTSELQSQSNLVCRLLLEKKKNRQNNKTNRVRAVSSIMHEVDFPYHVLAALATVRTPTFDPPRFVCTFQLLSMLRVYFVR